MSHHHRGPPPHHFTAAPQGPHAKPASAKKAMRDDLGGGNIPGVYDDNGGYAAAAQAPRGGARAQHGAQRRARGSVPLLFSVQVG